MALSGDKGISVKIGRMNIDMIQYTYTPQKGFTLVELAVVMLILGILVTMSVFGWSAWRTGVAETEIKNDLKGVATAFDSARNWNNGYPVFSGGTAFDGSNATKEVFISSGGVTMRYRSGDATGYCIDAVSKSRPAVTYFINTMTGDKNPARGTCAG